MTQNVVLVVFDTARADAFGPYGAGDGASPTVDQLSRSGSALQRAVAPASWTVPSHGSMLTGLMPRELGISQVWGVDPTPYREVLERRPELALAEVLRRAGYSTRAVSANLWIREAMGFGVGFEEFIVVAGQRSDRIKPQSMRERLSWDLDALRATADDGARQAERVIDGWLENLTGKPFFWFVNLVECHSPYLPPKPYGDLGARWRLRAAHEVQQHFTLDAIWRACAGGYDIPADAMARMRHLYGRSIRQMDDWLARLMERLSNHGVLDDTLLIVVSDHGENLGENRLIGHAFSLDDRLIRVPLISSGPGAFADDGIVSLVDLPRMLARALDMADQPWGDDLCQGIAVAQQDPPFPADHPRVRPALDAWGVDRAFERVTAQRTCATDGRFKLLLAGDDELLFDLADDPLEERPLASSEVPAEAVETIGRLRRAATAAGPREAMPATQESRPHDDNDDLERRMRLLGYM